MAEIGRFNTLKVSTINSSGAYLDGGKDGDILLPANEVPEHCKEADDLKVFIYLDAKQNLVATTKQVAAQVGEVAYLKVVEVNNVGAFLQWGPEKDLLVPFNQQRTKLMLGKSYLVFIYIDERTNRIAASSKLNKFISTNAAYYKRGQQVDLVVWEKTDLGYSTVINNKHWGLVYYADSVKPLSTG
ncbi:MAG: GntR family transcriptional regulator, partial [Enterobacterales bacterium]|nr:GntR family transcriptional regulator [Enterobacterales bacterium]